MKDTTYQEIPLLKVTSASYICKQIFSYIPLTDPEITGHLCENNAIFGKQQLKFKYQNNVFLKHTLYNPGA